MFSSENGDSAYYHRVRMRQACLEDWDATMELLFPGTAGAMKRMRAVIGEAITGVRSRTRLEQFDVAQLQQCVGILMALEPRLKAEKPRTRKNCSSSWNTRKRISAAPATSRRPLSRRCKQNAECLECCYEDLARKSTKNAITSPLRLYFVAVSSE